MKKVKKGMRRIVAVVIVFTLAAGLSANFPVKSSAAGSKTADLRLIFTTDLHGQLTTYEYQSKKKYTKGSLAKAYTLIQNARNKVGAGNTMTFDLGDSLYDYTTEYIYQQDENAIQPIYKGMAKIGYDAITIGNHDLDYGLSYLKNQLEGSGLSKLVVSSNIKNVVTKESEWNETKIIKKELKASDGKKVEVEVGIIGVVVPKLSTKTDDYTGVLESEDIVANVTRESQMLKDKGADIVVVLSHSGFGEDEPEELAKNASYALTKIENVDVVLCGHEHLAFPSDETGAAKFYNLPGVDKETGLVNGKVLMMSKARGSSIGIADLKLSVADDGSVKIKKAVPQIKYVTSSTKASEELDGDVIMGKWDEKLRNAVSEDDVVATVKEGDSINNYFGIIKESNAIQLFNDAKIAYGLSIVESKNPEYLGKYPIIAASSYRCYGEIDGDDYIYFDSDIKESDLIDFIKYNKRVSIYKITGAQLREWIEWSASAYEVPSSGSASTSDSIYSKFLEDSDLVGAVQPAYVTNWLNNYFFEGVEYIINPLEPARYNQAGQKISDGQRITSLTCNGIPVKDEDEFILVGEQITGKEAVSGIEKSMLYPSGTLGFTSVQSILKDYLEEIQATGDLSVKADNNWKVMYSKDYEYLVKSSSKSNMEAVGNGWSRIANNSYYAYYQADLGGWAEKNYSMDTDGPDLVVSKANSSTTKEGLKILVQANDISGVKSITYMRGDYRVQSGTWDDSGWYNARDGFTVTENGVYTVCATDIWGNRTAVKVKVSSIDEGILQKPVLKKYNNLSKTLRGTAEPGAKLVVEIDNVTYSFQINDDGTFKASLPLQNSGSKFNVWTVDEYNRESEKVTVTVRRKGPNLPDVEGVTNRDEKIQGNINDSNVQVLAIVGGSRVYLADEEAKELWEKSSIYNSKIKAVTTKVSIKENGNFSVKIPILTANSQIKLYTVDGIGRVSNVTKVKVAAEGPNQPVLYDVNTAENLIYGIVPECSKFKNKKYNIYAEVGNEAYEGVSKKDGTFVVNIGTAPKEGEEISVYATIKDENGEELYSAYRDTKAAAAEKYIMKNPMLSLNSISDKEDVLTGNYEISECELYISVDGKDFYDIVTDEAGNIDLTLDDYPKADKSIYAISRYDTGELEEIARVVVEKGLAQQPEILNEKLDNTTRTIRLITDESCKMVVTVGSKVYTSSESEYNDITGEYLYKVKIDRGRPGESVTALARNSAGDSKKITGTIIETAPDMPYIDPVTEDSKYITGKVHIIANPEDKGSPTVKSTGTKVWVQADGQIKEAKVYNDGSFKLKITKDISLEKGKAVFAWGENYYGGTGIKGKVNIKEGEKKKDKEK